MDKDYWIMSLGSVSHFVIHAQKLRKHNENQSEYIVFDM